MRRLLTCEVCGELRWRCAAWLPVLVAGAVLAGFAACGGAVAALVLW